MANLKLETGGGDTYSKVAERAKRMARETLTVEFEFNGIINLVTKDTNLDWLFRDYCNSWLMDWKTVGPNCLETYSVEIQNDLNSRKTIQDEKDEKRRKEVEAKDRQEQAAFEGKVAGVELEIIPEKAEEYKAYVEKNSKDGYSRGVIDYAENWAKLMQVEIAKGKTVQEVADETQKGLGYLGITGFMYGCAVNGLSRYWKHGEALRKWHNKEYGYEGEGVVNPAVLTLQTK